MPLSSRKCRSSTATVATRTPSAVEVAYKPALVNNCGLQLRDAQIEARDRLSRCGGHLTRPWSPRVRASQKTRAEIFKILVSC